MPTRPAPNQGTPTPPRRGQAPARRQLPRRQPPWCEAAVLAVLSAAVGLLGALGTSYVLGQGAPLLDGWATAAVAAAGAVLFALAACAVDAAYGRMAQLRAPGLGAPLPHAGAAPGAPSRWQRIAAFLTPAWDRRRFLICSGIMAACWLPWLVANFPAGAYWDTYYQIWQTFDGSHPIALIPFGDHADDTRIAEYLCDHHPVFDTLLYGAFTHASQALTGEWQLGVFAFACLQGAATAVALTGACAYLSRIGAPRGAVLACYLFFCLAPFVSNWALTVVKDSLFSLVYVPYLIMLCEVVRTKGAVLGSRRAAVAFVVLGLLLCLTKKTGVYVVVPTSLVALALYRRWWKPLAIQAASCVVAMALVLPLVAFPLLSVAPGGRQESLGLALQQTAACAAAYPDDATDEERAAINVVLPYDKLADLYVWNCHDDVKYEIKPSATDQNIRDYLSVWAAQGLRHPDAYLSAWLGVAGSYLAPVQALNVRTTTCNTDIDGVPVLYNPPELDWLREGMAAAYAAWCSVPGLCLPLEACVYVWWLPLLGAFVAWRRRLGCALLFVPGALVLASCLVGPIFDARYCLPLVYTTPLLLAFLAARVRERVAGLPCAPASGSPEGPQPAAATDARPRLRQPPDSLRP